MQVSSLPVVALLSASSSTKLIVESALNLFKVDFVVISSSLPLVGLVNSWAVYILLLVFSLWIVGYIPYTSLSLNVNP